MEARCCRSVTFAFHGDPAKQKKAPRKVYQLSFLILARLEKCSVTHLLTAIDAGGSDRISSEP